MIALLLAGLIATAPAIRAEEGQLFEAADGWRVFKQADGCVGFFKTPELSVSAFYPSARDGLTLIVHHGNVPELSDANQAVLIRVGKSQWGSVEASRHQGDGLPGIIFNVRRAKALAEFGKADSITFTKRFQPPKTAPLVGAAKGADMLARCLG